MAANPFLPPSMLGQPQTAPGGQPMRLPPVAAPGVQPMPSPGGLPTTMPGIRPINGVPPMTTPAVQPQGNRAFMPRPPHGMGHQNVQSNSPAQLAPGVLQLPPGMQQFQSGPPMTRPAGIIQGARFSPVPAYTAPITSNV